MNQGRIWCVVNPTVGLPLFLGSVAVTSLIVHYSVLSHTNWMGNYWQGGMKKAALNGSVAPVASMMSQTGPGFTVTVAPSTSIDGKSTPSFVVTVTPSATAGTDTVVGDSLSRPPDQLVMAMPDKN
jgi:light-harvesting protein B-800-850 alpha chain